MADGMCAAAKQQPEQQQQADNMRAQRLGGVCQHDGPCVDTCTAVVALQLLLHQTTPLPTTTSLLGLEKPLLDSNSLLDGTAVQVGGQQLQQHRQQQQSRQYDTVKQAIQQQQPDPCSCTAAAAAAATALALLGEPLR